MMSVGKVWYTKDAAGVEIRRGDRVKGSVYSEGRTQYVGSEGVVEDIDPDKRRDDSRILVRWDDTTIVPNPSQIAADGVRKV